MQLSEWSIKHPTLLFQKYKIANKKKSFSIKMRNFILSKKCRALNIQKLQIYSRSRSGTFIFMLAMLITKN